MSTFAETLENSINAEKELKKAETYFKRNPNGVFNTTMSYETCVELGFHVETSQYLGDTRNISFKHKSQYE